MADPRNLLMDSDYPLDKIIYITSGSISVPNSTNDTVTISSHGLPFTPLPILCWSNTSDFAITNELQDANYISNVFTTGAGQFYTARADSTNILVNRYNFSGSTQTFYYRIFCFMPSDADPDSVVTPTETLGDNFVINTDYNYLKLAYDGVLTTIDNTFTHNIGYYPRVQAWEESLGVSKLILAQDISTDPTGSLGQTSGVYINDTQIVWLNPSTYTKIHYRIYLDE